MPDHSIWSCTKQRTLRAPCGPVGIVCVYAQLPRIGMFRRNMGGMARDGYSSAKCGKPLVVDVPVVMHWLFSHHSNQKKRSLSPSESSVKNQTACSVRNVLCELPHGRKHHQNRLFSTTFFFCNIFSFLLSTLQHKETLSFL